MADLILYDKVYVTKIKYILYSVQDYIVLYEYRCSPSYMFLKLGDNCVVFEISRHQLEIWWSQIEFTGDACNWYLENYSIVQSQTSSIKQLH